MKTMNKPHVFDAALAMWGYDRRVLATAEECNELAAACTRFVNHKANGNRIAEEAADVEIMIEQLRHNGMSDMIDQHKTRKMARLSQRVGAEIPDAVSPASPSVSSLLEEAAEQLEMAQALYIDRQSSNRLAAARTCRCIAVLMHAAQSMIREQQQAEQRQGDK
jgi:NTP pyrophosphatase (non-canonical NTP hydrolase)